MIVQRCFSSTSIILCLGPFSYSKFLKIIYYVCKWRPLWGFWKPTSCQQSLINRVDLVRKIRPSTIKHSIVGSQGKIFATRALQSSLDGYRLARSSAEEWAWRERIPALRSRHPLHRRDALHAHQLGSGGIAVLRHSQVQWCLQTSRIGTAGRTMSGTHVGKYWWRSNTREVCTIESYMYGVRSLRWS